MKHCYRAGIDIGSTTAKLVILDERGVLCYSDYRRHCAHTQETLAELLEDACRGRGWLLSGGRCDLDRAAALVLDEFRAGKVGKITLERPKG